MFGSQSCTRIIPLHFLGQIKLNTYIYRFGNDKFNNQAHHYLTITLNCIASCQEQRACNEWTLFLLPKSLIRSKAHRTQTFYYKVRNYTLPFTKENDCNPSKKASCMHQAKRILIRGNPIPIKREWERRTFMLHVSLIFTF